MHALQGQGHAGMLVPLDSRTNSSPLPCCPSKEASWGTGYRSAASTSWPAAPDLAPSKGARCCWAPGVCVRSTTIRSESDGPPSKHTFRFRGICVRIVGHIRSQTPEPAELAALRIVTKACDLPVSSCSTAKGPCETIVVH